ncbi:MAG: hypothetical protein MJZ05_13650 [Fibrobacter sp.]|nr:hypothetical protein [Fibrobacter sp.]
MAKVGCKCGNTLSNVSDDSSDTLCVYAQSVVNEILKKNPTMKFLDFEYNYRYSNFDFWYCPECKRVYSFKFGENEANAVYKPSESRCSFSGNDLEGLEEILVFTNKKIFDFTEEDEHNNAVLSDFLKQVERPYKYFVSSDQRRIFCISQVPELKDFAYELEVKE